VTVVFPADFTVQEEFGGLTRSVFGSGEVVFSSGPIDDSTAVSAWFTAVQPVPQSDFLSRSFTLGHLSVALRYWADDPGWADQVESVLLQGYPVLRSLIGLGDPTGSTLTVTEATSEEIGGFAGSYDTATGQVQVSYFADPFVILHETAHMWFNTNLASDRWIDEAFASYYAEQAVLKLGLVDHAPVLTSTLMQAAVPLNDWAGSDQPSSTTDAYVYGATLEVARRIATLAGNDGLTAVWALARSGKAVYQPVSGAASEVAAGPLDWRRFLDLLEQTTGRQYTSIWSQWIVDSSQAPLLVQRAQTRSAYADLLTAAGTWGAPPDVRAALESWQFDNAESLIERAQTVLSQRDQIRVDAAREGVQPPGTLQTKFATGSVTAAAVEATDEQAVLALIDAARRAEADSQGDTRILGLLGTDPAADLAAAGKAFESGDLGQALTLASRAQSAWEGANGTGQARLFGISAMLGGAALLGLLAFWVRREGRKRGRLSLAIEEDGRAGRDEGREAEQVLGGDQSVGSGSQSGWPLPGRTPPDGPGPGRPATGGSTDKGKGEAGEPDEPGEPGEPDEPGEPIKPDELGELDESAYDLLQRGHELLRDRHNAQAAVVLERAARVAPGKGSILEALGRAYFNSGQHARAAEAFEALLELDPSADYGHFGLGLAFIRLGRADEGRTHLRIAVALDPASATYRRALQRVDASRT
jgi:tetratricopeptide (TPR) repeat protein